MSINKNTIEMAKNAGHSGGYSTLVTVAAPFHGDHTLVTHEKKSVIRHKRVIKWLSQRYIPR